MWNLNYSEKKPESENGHRTPKLVKLQDEYAELK